MFGVFPTSEKFCRLTILHLTASSDPLFLLHHSNVDRHFALWQNYHGHDGVDTDDYGRNVSN